MNVELLEKIAAHALAFPKTIAMSIYAEKVDRDDDHPCGTVGCIAGHTVRMSNPEKFNELVGSDWDHQFKDEAQKLLGITRTQANDLFFTDSWPDPFLEKWHRLGMGSAERAQVFHNRIHHFIRTGK